MLVGLGTLLFLERFTMTKVIWLSVAFVGTLLIVHAKSDADYNGTDFFLDDDGARRGILLRRRCHYHLRSLRVYRLTGSR